MRLARPRWAYATFPKEYWSSVVLEVLQVQRKTFNLGRLLQRMGQLGGEAKPLFEEELQAKRETLGERNLDSLENMGNLLMDMGQMEEARPLLEKALRTNRETLGDRHPNTLTSIGDMGALLQDMGQLEEAKPLYEEALQGKREML